MTIISPEVGVGKTPPEQFTITIVPMPGDPRPAIIRLRSALKFLRRACFLRCVALSDATGSAVEE